VVGNLTADLDEPGDCGATQHSFDGGSAAIERDRFTGNQVGVVDSEEPDRESFRGDVHSGTAGNSGLFSVCAWRHSLQTWSAIGP